MKNNLHNIICLLALICLASCSRNEKYFHLEGTIKGMPSQTVALEELGFNEIKLIDSTHSDKDGNFKLKGLYGEPALYRLKMGEQIVLVVVDGEKIKIRANWEDPANYTAEGSPGSNSLAAFMQNYIRANKDMLAMEMASDSMTAATTPDSLMLTVRKDLNGRAQELKDYIKKYSDTTKSLPVALFVASRLLNDDTESEYFRTFSEGLAKRFPENHLATEFREKVKEKLAAEVKTTSGPRIGTVAPDFTLNSLEGKSVSLNAFRGKYVLIDFWASWCPPCRAENPNVVAAYNKFKDKNFTILGVSLDKDKDKWQEAVTKDGLTWNHVSDLQGWSSTVAALYGVQSIPANFLVDPAGKIVAVNLRGSDLEKVLSSKLNAEGNLVQK